MSVPGPAYDVDAVVLDIEGTTSATGFVVDVLYPYSRARFAEAAHRAGRGARGGTGDRAGT